MRFRSFIRPSPFVTLYHPFSRNLEMYQNIFCCWCSLSLSTRDVTIIEMKWARDNTRKLKNAWESHAMKKRKPQPLKFKFSIICTHCEIQIVEWRHRPREEEINLIYEIYENISLFHIFSLSRWRLPQIVSLWFIKLWWKILL